MGSPQSETGDPRGGRNNFTTTRLSLPDCADPKHGEAGTRGSPAQLPPALPAPTILTRTPTTGAAPSTPQQTWAPTTFPRLPSSSPPLLHQSPRGAQSSLPEPPRAGDPHKLRTNQDTFHNNGLLQRPINIIPLMQQSLIKDLQIP